VNASPESLPKVQLSRMQSLRLAAVGITLAFMVLRVVPDTIRIGIPLGVFGYTTNDDGIVTKVPEQRTKGSDAILLGDKVRIDRIKPFDRKPGLAREAYTRENFDRSLPIERRGKERALALKAERESVAVRALAMLRIVLYVAIAGFGALLYIIKPRLATFAFFVYCVGQPEPTTYSDVIFDVPWREIPTWIGDTITGQAPVGLLAFASCLLFTGRRERLIIGTVLGGVAFALGTLYAADAWRVNYAALASEAWRLAYVRSVTVVQALTVLGFVVAFFRARGANRQRTGWIVAAFVASVGGAFVSDHVLASHQHVWENGVLLSLSVLPVLAVWIAVARHHYFDVDFVVSRALVYTSITAAVVFTVGGSEELLTYIFYNNTDLAYGLIIAISLFVGAGFGRVRNFLEHFVDRFIFRERHQQLLDLERVAANILDAEDEQAVWDALLLEVPGILDLAFSGIMLRTAEGGYRLAHQWQWPSDCVDALGPEHQLTRDIYRTRGMLPDDAVRSTMIKQLFPTERLTYAAPLYFDRSVTALVFYGHSVTGLDLDPEERTVLIHVMANASIALNAVELARYRRAAGEGTFLPA
jgi:hypothetical protein